MTIELDAWDRDWLSRTHTLAEYQSEIKESMERNAIYFRRIMELMDQVAELKAEVERLRGQRAGCGYPDCLVDNRCARLWAGECSGPRA